MASNPTFALLRHAFFTALPTELMEGGPDQQYDLDAAIVGVQECQRIVTELRILALREHDIAELRNAQTLTEEVKIANAVIMMLRSRQSQGSRIVLPETRA